MNDKMSWLTLVTYNFKERPYKGKSMDKWFIFYSLKTPYFILLTILVIIIIIKLFLSQILIGHLINIPKHVIGSY
jgi:hypothetical protein